MQVQLNYQKFFVVIKIVIICFGDHIFPTCESFEAETYNTPFQDIQSQLRADLLSVYDPMEVPKENNSATQLHLKFFPNYFYVDEKASTFTLDTITQMRWHDDKIRWDPLKYDNLTRIRFRANQLWKPDLTVYNELSVTISDFCNSASKKTFHYSHPVSITAYHTGLIIWMPPTRYDTKCVHDVRKWPFDANTCYVRIGSWTHSGEDVFMVNKPNDPQMTLQYMIFIPDWKTTTVATWIQDKVFQCCPSYQEFGVSWGFKRRSAHPFALVCVPAIAIAIMILAAFWMSPVSVERSGLLIVGLIINATFLKYVYDIIPPNGNSVPLLILYYSDSLAMITIAILWTVISRYIALTKATSNIPLPQFITRFLESWPSKILCIAPRPDAGLPSHSNTVSNDDDDTGLIGLKANITNDWAWFAHLMDRIIFFVYTIIYLIFVVAFL